MNSGTLHGVKVTVCAPCGSLRLYFTEYLFTVMNGIVKCLFISLYDCNVFCITIYLCATLVMLLK